MSRRADILPTWVPRGLARQAAAEYVGVGLSKFDEMVGDGRMPQPKMVDRRLVWDRMALDAAFEDLPDRRANGDAPVELTGFEGWQP